MRFWKGLEREDNLGEMTLFVESPVINNKVVSDVKKKLSENPDCTRVYFGAGGVCKPTTLVEVDCESLPDIECVAEIGESSPILRSSKVSMFNKIIVTRISQLLPPNAVFKVDDGSKLQVFSKDMEVDYSEVLDGKYSNDVDV